MNIFTDRLPDSITFDGKKYPLKTGFKNWVMAGHLALLQSGKQEDILKILFLCYKKRLPPALSVALNGILDFYSGAFTGDNVGKTLKPAQNQASHRLFDFYYDSKYIYSDFMSVYGIDLTHENIHFYKFCTLFEGLPESSKIMQLIKLRGINLSEVESPELKRKYARLKRIYSLTRCMPEHIKRQELGKAFNMFF